MSKTGSAAIALVIAVVVAAICPAVAGEEDHERARRALDRGEVMPLRSILDRVERDYPGEVVEVELEREHGRWIYEIRVLRRGGALVELEIDARDGEVLAVGGARESRKGDR